MKAALDVVVVITIVVIFIYKMMLHCIIKKKTKTNKGKAKCNKIINITRITAEEKKINKLLTNDFVN